eukprot:495609_1
MIGNTLIDARSIGYQLFISSPVRPLIRPRLVFNTKPNQDTKANQQNSCCVNISRSEYDGLCSICGLWNYAKRFMTFMSCVIEGSQVSDNEAEHYRLIRIDYHALIGHGSLAWV